MGPTHGRDGSHLEAAVVLVVSALMALAASGTGLLMHILLAVTIGGIGLAAVRRRV
jgi:hypothetical protein